MRKKFSKPQSNNVPSAVLCKPILKCCSFHLSYPADFSKQIRAVKLILQPKLMFVLTRVNTADLLKERLRIVRC